MAKLTTEDKEWRAESDLHTLVEAEKIKSDKTRFNAASRKANKLAKEKEAEVKAVKKLVKPKKPKTKKVIKRTSKKN